LDRKEQDAIRTAADARKKFQQQCQQLRIKGDSIEEEVRLLTRELPAQYETIIKLIRENKVQLQSAMQYYFDFMNQVSNMGTSVNTIQYICPLLNTFVLNDSVSKQCSVFDYKTFKGEILVDAHNAALVEQARQAVEKTKSSSSSSSSSTIAVTAGDDENSFEIELDDAGDADTSNNTSSNTHTIQQQETTSKYVDLMSQHVLDLDEFRYSLITEVLELQSFYEGRIYEKKTVGAAADTAHALQSQDQLQKLQAHYSLVSQIVALLDQERFKLLIMIKTSKK